MVPRNKVVPGISYPLQDCHTSQVFGDKKRGLLSIIYLENCWEGKKGSSKQQNPFLRLVEGNKKMWCHKNASWDFERGQTCNVMVTANPLRLRREERQLWCRDNSLLRIERDKMWCRERVTIAAASWATRKQAPFMEKDGRKKTRAVRSKNHWKTRVCKLGVVFRSRVFTGVLCVGF